MADRRLPLALALSLTLLAGGAASAAESKGAPTPGLTKPVPAPPSATPQPPSVAPPPGPAARLSELDELFGIIRLMRQRLKVTEETAFFIGQRHMKIMTYSTPLYEVARKWALAYRRAVLRLQKLPVSDYLCHPDRFVELKDVVEWGKLHAIGEPWYYKKGYRRALPILFPGDVPPCLWDESPPR